MQRLSNFTPPRDAGVSHSAMTSGQMLDAAHFAVCLNASNVCNCQLAASTVVIINSYTHNCTYIFGIYAEISSKFYFVTSKSKQKLLLHSNTLLSRLYCPTLQICDFEQHMAILASAVAKIYFRDVNHGVEMCA